MTTIRSMTAADKPCVLEMMRTFYTSPAVHTDGSQEIYEADIDNCVGENPFGEGFILEENGNIQGYAMIAKSYSTEFGKNCIWVEDLYLKEEFRGKGLGKQFFDFIDRQYTDCIFRLEVEKENLPAVRLYTKCGFTELPYIEMKK